MSKLRMLDLFCGRLGWSKAFLARGWDVVAVDLVRPELPECGNALNQLEFLEIDVMRITDRFFRDYRFDFICASSPCEEFSTMRNFRPPVPYPTNGIRLFNHTREICEASGIPYIMENVSGAGKFVGRAVAHCGPYYLWGTGVPPILPQGINKGMTELAMGLREHKGKPGWDDRHGKLGQTPTARVATIPPELAATVAAYAERICEKVGGIL